MDKRLLGDPGTPAFQVTSYPFYLINRLASRYNAAIEAILREIELDIPSWRVLMILGEETPRGVRSIAEAAVSPLSTMTRRARCAGNRSVADNRGRGKARAGTQGDLADLSQGDPRPFRRRFRPADRAAEPALRQSRRRLTAQARFALRSQAGTPMRVHPDYWIH